MCTYLQKMVSKSIMIINYSLIIVKTHIMQEQWIWFVYRGRRHIPQMQLAARQMHHIFQWHSLLLALLQLTAKECVRS